MQTYSKKISNAIVDEFENASPWNDPKEIDGTKIFISQTFEGNTSAIELFLKPDPLKSDLRVVIKMNDTPKLLSIGRNPGRFMLQDLGENEISDLRKVLNRLRAGEQNAIRPISNLFVFVW